jgi:hypothetical protein
MTAATHLLRVSVLPAVVCIATLLVLPDLADAVPSRSLSAATCSSGSITANLSWGTKCLRVGEFCKIANPEYHDYGFDCPASGFLTYYQGPSSPTPTTPPPLAGTPSIGVGQTVLVGPRTRMSGCVRGPRPDRRCSPGAYSSALTSAVICSPGFRTSTIRNVPQDEKFQVEQEYGMPAAYYGYTIEIDHIVPLELGGSNDISNLFPEPGSGGASYHVKDALENRLHDMVCSGVMSLRAAQIGIASNWEALYGRVFGQAP